MNILGNPNVKTIGTIPAFFKTGTLCATTLKREQDEFAPFCEYTDDVPDFDTYVQHVASTTLAEWGGHLELRALSVALQRPIHVYSVSNGAKPLEILPPSTSSLLPIQLSYHLHFYGLGEHYNQVVPKTVATVNDRPEESEQ
jgi:OTU domain-containing protein 6